ncbi:hypothetical protein BDQ17DRAFT_1331520 [Cyathus striatus]|nr:hypothetical protein BDQ17DRAFT_1331520 [Cyathus striatus]
MLDQLSGVFIPKCMPLYANHIHDCTGIRTDPYSFYIGPNSKTSQQPIFAFDFGVVTILEASSSSSFMALKYTDIPESSVDNLELPLKLIFNSMILLPPANSQNTQPLYHIHIGMNCFMPSSFITTITRGGNEHGELVGDFKMGIVDKTSTLLIWDTEFKLNDILSKEGSQLLATWAWFSNDPKHRLIWKSTTMVLKICQTDG